MKTTLYSIIAAAAAIGFAQAQTAYTTPVGYTTQTLAANTFNLVGFNVLNPTIAAGVLTGVSGADLTDTNANFITALPVGKMCVIEIIDGTAAGTVQEFIAWSVDTITLPSAVAGVAAGNSYRVRVVSALQELFPVGFLTGSATAPNADKVWVPDGMGGYTKYWYKITLPPVGWHTTSTGSDNTGQVLTDIPLPYIDGILVEKKGVVKDFVLTGEVKTTGSNALINPAFNLVSIVPPVGLTLFTSGLQSDVLGSATAPNADKIWVPNGLGGYTKYWNKITLPPVGWHTTSTGSDNTGQVLVDVPLTPGVLIERKGVAKVFTFNVPSFYNSL
jgi:hypothetical protein